MKERINWIDWAKTWCMTIVVFEHTPHAPILFCKKTEHYIEKSII